jgi:hypothetical protein
MVLIAVRSRDRILHVGLFIGTPFAAASAPLGSREAPLGGRAMVERAGEGDR